MNKLNTGMETFPCACFLRHSERQKTIRKCHGAGMVRDENVDSDGMVVKSLELHIRKRWSGKDFFW